MNWRALVPFGRHRNPGQDLARMGVEKRRRTVSEVARQIRRELELPPAPALERRAP